MILRAGLTGGLASGKSTVARMFGDLGCSTIDADAIVASLYRPGNSGHAALVRVYGPEILLANGEVDRPKLAARAFSSPAEAQRLNALIHPLVIEEEGRLMEQEAARARGRHQIVVVEATLLLESGGRRRSDKIIVVDVAPEIQLARAVARGMSREEAQRRIAHQMRREERLSMADYVIDNSGDLRQTAAEVRRVFSALRAELERMTTK